ncbi:thioredoxin reductase (NADPH) [Jannaschia seohaensis]|uniref:Thioredoxin reductase (NADPH) n=1 Tax=Jannaschia seohaensis TaxID=475081 RepID=A0A2Y9A918_9RHOB|nr:thioredoxin reductase (NADPH) [Jannaschia seohaensis]SSA38697.1 thioredoxin reductase (NADPH) [Jannaschia seohaensis]
MLCARDLEFDADETHDLRSLGAVHAGAEGLSARAVEEATIGGQAGATSWVETEKGLSERQVGHRSTRVGRGSGDEVWRGSRRTARGPPGTPGATTAAFASRSTTGPRLVPARVIVTGAQCCRLWLDRPERLEGAGISRAATEMEARICRNRDVPIIGGGNSAGQAAMLLSCHARCVHLLVNGGSLAASISSHLPSRLDADPAIRIRCHTGLPRCMGTRIRRRSRSGATGSCRGGRPDGSPRLVRHGWCRVEYRMARRGGGVRRERLSGEAGRGGARRPYATSTEGIFAGGDVRADSVTPVASAVSEGPVVNSKAWEHVSRQRDAAGLVARSCAQSGRPPPACAPEAFTSRAAPGPHRPGARGLVSLCESAFAVATAARRGKAR